jgi:hypothetical protein
MKKWYYTWHSHTNNVSVFETDQYDGRDGYKTKEDAIKDAKDMLIKRQQCIGLDISEKSNELSILISKMNGINESLSKIK